MNGARIFRVRWTEGDDVTRREALTKLLLRQGYALARTNKDGTEIWEADELKNVPLPAWVGPSFAGGTVDLKRRSCGWIGWSATLAIWRRRANANMKAAFEEPSNPRDELAELEEAS